MDTMLEKIDEDEELVFGMSLQNDSSLDLNIN
jgi:hypothetical protein